MKRGVLQENLAQKSTAIATTAAQTCPVLVGKSLLQDAAGFLNTTQEIYVIQDRG